MLWSVYGYDQPELDLMTMHVNLSDEMSAYIKGKVSSGFYGNATEVIRDALRRMQAEEERVTAFRAAVAVGQAELDRGEGIVYTPKLMDEIFAEAMANLDSEEEIDPDVLP
jgi:antitoxin ParD1/3/4